VWRSAAESGHGRGVLRADVWRSGVRRNRFMLVAHNWIAGLITDNV